MGGGGGVGVYFFECYFKLQFSPFWSLYFGEILSFLKKNKPSPEKKLPPPLSLT